MYKVIILSVTADLSQDMFDALLPFVSDERQKKVSRYHFNQDAQNSLLGDILTRIKICEATKLSNDQLEFSANIYGKPFLVNFPNIHYNISHSSRYIACALSDVPVGIDIEQLKSFNSKIANRFFAFDEAAYIEGAQGCQKMRRFFEVWSKKESRIKWEGKGLHIPLPSFSVISHHDNKQLHYHKVFENAEAICHVCTQISYEPSVEIIDIDGLYLLAFESNFCYSRKG